MKPKFAYLVVALVVLIATNVAKSQGPNINEVDSIIDQLEKRLRDQEDSGLTFSERDWQKVDKEKSVKQKLKFEKGQTITAKAKDTEENDDLKILGAAVDGLEDDIERLSAEVQGFKQAAMESAKIDNFLELSARMNDAHRAAIKSISVRIDDFEVYNVDDISGLWMTTKNLPIYHGPMQPGKHKLEVETRIVLNEEKNLPLNKNVYRHLQQTFQIEIAAGVSRKKYAIEISTAKDVNAPTNITLVE